MESQQKLFKEKRALAEETETLTAELFGEANRMVAEERRHADELVKVNMDLMARLEKMVRARSAASYKSGYFASSSS